jgi:integrase
MTEQAIQPVRRQRRRVLTDKMVAELPRRSAPYFHPDPELPKHGIRVRTSGPGAYTVICRDPYGKQKWTKIGSTAEMKISEAREIARAAIKRVEAGLAPFEAPKPKPHSVENVAHEWLKRHVEKNELRTAAERRRIVEKYILLPSWRDRVFVDIKRRDVAALLDHIEDQHGPAMADQVLNVLRSMASWVQQRDDDYAPPFVKGMRRTPLQDRKRARILDDSELRRVWQAAGNAGTYGALVKLLLLTAQRREKVLTMRWSDVSSSGVWTIPTAPREKGNPGALRLPKQALAVLKSIPRFAGNDQVFASTNGQRFVFNHNRKKRALDKASGVANWRVHDLRRSARSLMSRAGVATEIAERILGHARPAMEATYNVHRYDSEKAAALVKLATLVGRIVAGPSDNVVVLRDAGAQP